eukprot:643480-Pleurochrysis_carterae.AAC.1
MLERGFCGCRREDLCEIKLASAGFALSVTKRVGKQHKVALKEDEFTEGEPIFRIRCVAQGGEGGSAEGGEFV